MSSGIIYCHEDSGKAMVDKVVPRNGDSVHGIQIVRVKRTVEGGVALGI